MRLGRILLLISAFGLLSGVTQAQTPSPAQMGITTASPNAVQVLDSSHTWATLGTVDPATHLFSVAGLSALVSSFNTRTGAVVLNSSDVTSALGFTPIPASGAPVQSVATRTGVVTLTHSDITDWVATLAPYALLNSPAFTGTPSLPTGTTGVTQTAGDSSTKLATTAFVGNAIIAGAYTLPIATPSVLGGVKPDGTTINVDGSGVISGTPSGVTANATPTSGFTAGQLLMSDGAKVQPLVQSTPSLNSMVSLGGVTYPMYFGGTTTGYPGVVFAEAMVGFNPAYGVSINLTGLSNIGVVVSTGGYIGFNSASNYASSPPDTTLYGQYTGIINQRNSTVAQEFNVYNTYTNASNSEWASLDWQTTPNVLTIGAQANGTGTVRPVNIVGSNLQINGTAAVSCAAGTVSLTTLVVTKGIITHC